MKILQIFLIILAFTACKKEKKSTEKVIESSTIVEQESNEWITLFDGKTFDGWHIYMTDSISDEWQIENGAMVFTPRPDKNHGMSNIVTDKEYTNFILSLEWKISEAGNSGIFWGIFESKKYPVPYKTAPEIQILDDLKHPDKAHEKHLAGSLYDMVSPSKNAINKVGEWNLCTIKIDHKSNTGSVTLNGTEIVTFPVHGDKWDKMVTNSKFKDWEDFGKFKTGKIGFQDHGNKVSFQNIKIKEI